jgi:hypothetical protein
MTAAQRSLQIVEDVLPPVGGLGEAMRRLPTDRHRLFVNFLFSVRPPGRGAPVKAAKAAGYGKPGTNARTWSAIAARLMADPRVSDAIQEVGKQYVAALGPQAVASLEALLSDSTHRHHAKAVGMVINLLAPATSLHTVSVRHEAGPTLVESTAVLERIASLAARFSVNLPAPPPPIDAEFSEVSDEAPQ